MQVGRWLQAIEKGPGNMRQSDKSFSRGEPAEVATMDPVVITSRHRQETVAE
jgi:hypothetical protein